MDKRKERFLKFLPYRPENGCWEYQGSRTPYGYGSFSWSTQKGKEMAHRASWLLFRGPIPKGMHLCHKCDNPPCVNPDHLFLGTMKDNMQDAKTKERMRNGSIKGVCFKGHAMNVGRTGKRWCKLCAREYAREKYRKSHNIDPSKFKTLKPQTF